ncbi:MAG: SAM-dependent DNA methyltransferase [Candidatus Binataceae bacterium]
MLLAALAEFPTVSEGIGVDINPTHLSSVRSQLDAPALLARVKLEQADFFALEWANLLRGLPEPILVLGNPPWVTNSELSRLNSGNLPPKRNLDRLGGMDALTGRSNFDISEWMLRHLFKLIAHKDAVLAMLCKTSVARRVLAALWKSGPAPRASAIYRIDAKLEFGAAVDACLLVCRTDRSQDDRSCDVFSSLDSAERESSFGFRGNAMVADIGAYESRRHLEGREWCKWRSGIKHDCAGVLQLRKDGDCFLNGLGESVDLEPDFVFPLMRGSDLARTGGDAASDWLLVPQRRVGEGTQVIESIAPRTWDYLLRHSKMLDCRKSSIYRNRPRFSIFGIGEYTFAPWKVAISGFYKRLKFVTLGPVDGKPTVLDDTSYFVSCDNQAEAQLIASLLDSEPAHEFYRSLIFWDSKRPITAEILSRLDLLALSKEMHKQTEFRAFLSRKNRDHLGMIQGTLLE